MKFIVKEFLSLPPGGRFPGSQNPEESLCVELAVEMEDNGSPILRWENGMTHYQIDWTKQMNQIFLFIVLILEELRRTE